jgi:hypothetical protein
MAPFLAQALAGSGVGELGSSAPALCGDHENHVPEGLFEL